MGEECGKEVGEAFMRIHYAKIKLNKDEGKCEIIDNFNKKSFTTFKSSDDGDCINIQDSQDNSTIFSILRLRETKFAIQSSEAQSLGEIHVERPNQGPVAAELITEDGHFRLQATKMPLIQKSNEFQITHPNTGDVVGRINIVRSKAVISMQPELQVFHRVRIVGTAIILLEIYNQTW